MPEAKPYDIPKQLVWEAYQRVKANRGAAGVDGESLAAFETGPEEQPLQDLESDVVGLVLSAARAARRDTEGQRRHAPIGHSDRGRSRGADGREDGSGAAGGTACSTRTPTAIDPAGRRSTRWGWRGSGAGTTDWVIDLDIKAFFDSIPHDLVERAVAHHTDLPWVRLYVARWLRAPVQRPDGTLEERTKGTPQGGVVSPLLANLFLHYAFDLWMQRTLSGHPVRALCGRCDRPLPE